MLVGEDHRMQWFIFRFSVFSYANHKYFLIQHLRLYFMNMCSDHDNQLAIIKFVVFDLPWTHKIYMNTKIPVQFKMFKTFSYASNRNLNSVILSFSFFFRNKKNISWFLYVLVHYSIFPWTIFSFHFFSVLIYTNYYLMCILKNKNKIYGFIRNMFFSIMFKY